MTVGNRISTLRRKKGYTQEYLAIHLDVSRQAVSKWEQDKTNPDTKNLIKLAEILDSSVSYIATGHDPEKYRQNKICQILRKKRDSSLNLGSFALFVGLALMILGIFLFLWLSWEIVWVVISILIGLSGAGCTVAGIALLVRSDRIERELEENI